MNTEATANTKTKLNANANTNMNPNTDANTNASSELGRDSLPVLTLLVCSCVGKGSGTYRQAVTEALRDIQASCHRKGSIEPVGDSLCV